MANDIRRIREKVKKYMRLKGCGTDSNYLWKDYLETQTLTQLRKEIQMVGTDGTVINQGKIAPRLSVTARYFGTRIQVYMDMDGGLFFNMTKEEIAFTPFPCHPGQNCLGVDGEAAIGWLLEFGIPGESRQRMIDQCRIKRSKL